MHKTPFLGRGGRKREVSPRSLVRVKIVLYSGPVPLYIGWVTTMTTAKKCPYPNGNLGAKAGGSLGETEGKEVGGRGGGLGVREDSARMKTRMKMEAAGRLRGGAVAEDAAGKEEEEAVEAAAAVGAGGRGRRATEAGAGRAEGLAGLNPLLLKRCGMLLQHIPMTSYYGVNLK